MSVYVSDEVWANLDPAAAQLSLRTRIKVTLCCLVAAAVAFLVLALTASGLVINRFTVSDGNSSGGSFTSCWQTMKIKNSGWFDQRVTASTLQPNGTGATLARSLAGATIQSGATRVITLHFTGLMCHQLLTAPVFQNGTRTPPDLILRLKRPWGSSTATIRLAPQNNDGLTVQW